MNFYVVQIKMKTGELRFVRVHDHTSGYRNPTLVKAKRGASKLESHALAGIVSDWFWENHWDDELHSSRSTEVIRSK